MYMWNGYIIEYMIFWERAIIFDLERKIKKKYVKKIEEK